MHSHNNDVIRHERLNKLIKFLSTDINEMPVSIAEKRMLLRALMNIHSGDNLPSEYFELQDEELQDQLNENELTQISEITPSPLHKKLRLWKGDIAKLKADAIVNAANNKLLGCFQPLHNCIDNIIHSKSGLQLRRECKRIMDLQGADEAAGGAKITPAYNLPAKWVIHTVGPIIYGEQPNSKERQELADCYASCLKLAEKYNAESVAFCCISTGVFHFPKGLAAKIAVETVMEMIGSINIDTVIFDVFSEEDEMIYKKLLGYDHG